MKSITVSEEALNTIYMLLDERAEKLRLTAGKESVYLADINKALEELDRSIERC